MQSCRKALKTQVFRFEPMDAQLEHAIARKNEGTPSRKVRKLASGAGAGFQEICHTAVAYEEAWATGSMSAVRIQQLAYCNYLDGMAHPSILRLAQLGSWGEHVGNCHRDLERLLLQDCNAPQPYTFQVQVSNPKGEAGKRYFAAASMLLPHEVIAWLDRHHPVHLKRFLGVDLLQEWWDEQPLDDPRLEGHPVLDRRDYKSKAIPMVVHGDGAEYGGRHSADMLSWTGLLTSSSGFSQKPLDTKFYAASIPKDVKHAKSSDELCRVFVWSLTAWWKGEFPSHDHLGKPLKDGREHRAGEQICKDGWFGFVFNLSADIDWWSNAWKAAHHSSGSFCEWCPANHTKGPMQFTDVSPTAGYKLRVLTSGDARRQRVSDCPIWELPGVHIHMLGIDVLHILHQGVLLHFFGSILHTLVYYELPGTPQRNLQVIMKRISELYDDISPDATSRVRSLTLKSFCDPTAPHAHYPVLKTSAVKAAEAKSLAPIIASLLHEYDTGDDPPGRSRRRILAATYLARFCVAIEGPGMHFTREHSDAIMKTCDRFLHNYVWLNDSYSKSGILAFNFVPKFHFMWHLAVQCRYGVHDSTLAQSFGIPMPISTRIQKGFPWFPKTISTGSRRFPSMR